MPFQISCPSCASVCGVPDVLHGKNVKCPHCQYIFLGVPPAPVREELLEVIPLEEPAAPATFGAPFPSQPGQPVPWNSPRLAPLQPAPWGNETPSSNRGILIVGGLIMGSMLIMGGLLWAVIATAEPMGFEDFAEIVNEQDKERADADLRPGGDDDFHMFPAAEPSRRRDELIANGDFEQGARGFETSYRHRPGNIRDEFAFCIIDNPRHAHFSAASFLDRSGTGKMMAVNGGNAADRLLWSQTVDVRPNQPYRFSLYVASWYAEAPAELEIKINDAVIAKVTAPRQTGVWQRVDAVWNSNADDEAIIDIYNLNRAVAGNDFAIDDVSLRGRKP